MSTIPHRLSFSPSLRLSFSSSLPLSFFPLFSPTFFLTLLALAAAPGAHAYVPFRSTWPSGDIPLRLQLDASAATRIFPLIDGAMSWNVVAQSALEDWNLQLGRSHFTSTISTTTFSARQEFDGLNQVSFSTNTYGLAFSPFELAATLLDNSDGLGDTVRSREADVIVNKSVVWNSFRGPARRPATEPISTDLRRVLLHEFGHVLGLTHPDLATPRQNVASALNSFITDIETLQPDDIAGITYLYTTPIVPPVLTTQPSPQTASIGSTAQLTIAVNNQDPPVPDDFHSYHWYFKAAGATTFEALFTLVKPGSLTFGSVQLEDAGSYYFQAITPDHTLTSPTVTLTTTPATLAPETQLANLSTRGIGGSGPRSMIVGFVVTGTRPKTVLLRAAGPTLATFGVTGTLADPQLILKNSVGTTVATSTALWDQSPNAPDIRTATSRVGAFTLPAGSRDAVIFTTLAPGNYTATTTSPSNATGTILIEVYDADATRDSASRITNLSTRGYVSTGSDTLIAGFVVSGPGPRTYLVRIAGDTLRSLGVTATLDDPFLKLFTGSTLIREKDDWDSPVSFQPALRAAFTSVGAFVFSDRQEPAMLVTLRPGSYTAQATGLTNDGSTNPTGNALIEIYEVP